MIDIDNLGEFEAAVSKLVAETLVEDVGVYCGRNEGDDSDDAYNKVCEILKKYVCPTYMAMKKANRNKLIKITAEIAFTNMWHAHDHGHVLHATASFVCYALEHGLNVACSEYP